MEKFSIVENINRDILNRKIAEFACKENYEPYVFANNETIDAMMKQTSIEFNSVTYSRGDIKTCASNCFVGEYRGRKMFKDDTLKFGEIELR